MNCRLRSGTKLSDMGLVHEDLWFMVRAIAIPNKFFPEDEVRRFLRSVIRLGDRQLFLTRGGRLGSVKKGVSHGDMVCVFNGAPVPHVLRKASDIDDGTERWQFVGDAYVHSLMNFEADAIDIEVKDVVLV
jgi:hypothetical protein